MHISLERKNHAFLVFSLLLHVLIFSCIILQFRQTIQHVSVGDSNHDAINAYFVKAQPEAKQKQLTTKHGIHIQQQSQVRKKQTAGQQQSTAASKGNSTQGLLALLHNAIQQQQTYPESAMDMGREGTASVAFDLFQDGHIQHIRIVGSSGTESLDLAALSAVTLAAPFHGVDQFINTVENYRIDVVFKLS